MTANTDFIKVRDYLTPVGQDILSKGSYAAWKASLGGGSTTVTWNDVTGKPMFGTASLLDSDNDNTLAANSATRLPTQQAMKGYVDSLINGLKWKASVRVASVVNGALSTAFAAGQVVDGVTLATNDRILIKAQTNGAENGIYVVNASGAPTRSTDADTGTEIKNATVTVDEGSQAEWQWTCSNNGTITLGTTALTFVTTGGGGRLLVANNFSDVADPDAARNNISAQKAGGVVNTPASTAATAGLKAPPGTAPTSPGDGDIWTTTAGMYVRINGVTVGPLSAGGAALGPTQTISAARALNSTDGDTFVDGYYRNTTGATRTYDIVFLNNGGSNPQLDKSTAASPGVFSTNVSAGSATVTNVTLENNAYFRLRETQPAQSGAATIIPKS